MTLKVTLWERCVMVHLSIRRICLGRLHSDTWWLLVRRRTTPTAGVQQIVFVVCPHAHAPNVAGAVLQGCTASSIGVATAPGTRSPKWANNSTAAVAAGRSTPWMPAAPLVVLYWCALSLLGGSAVQSGAVVFALSANGSYKAIHLFVPACTAGSED